MKWLLVGQGFRPAKWLSRHFRRLGRLFGYFADTTRGKQKSAPKSRRGGAQQSQVVSAEGVAEPWLRGTWPGLDPVIGHLIRAGEHIREDLRKALTPLETREVWATPQGMTSAGFHAKHLAGSTRRLCAYLSGRGLTEEEAAAIGAERTGDESAAQLIRLVDDALDLYERQVRALQPEDFATIRYVGRARLPVTAISLAIHIAEHGQRHVGQAISAAKLARSVHHD